jgi:hypothetical protein
MKFLLPIALAAASLACLPVASAEHPGSTPILLGRDAVRKELALTKKQAAQLDRIRADFKADARLLTTRPPANAVEKQAANSSVAALLAKYNAKADEVLTTPQQERLLQIERQTLGGLMLFLPSEQKRLGLDVGQVASLAKVHEVGQAFASRITASYEQGDISLAERLETLRKYRIKESKKCLRVLTPKQGRIFQTLQGKKFVPA